MQLIRKDEAKDFKEGLSFASKEYTPSSGDMNIARIEIHGRVPETGFMRNTKVKEIIYVESGEGAVTVNGETMPISTGDVLFYKENEEVAWEGDFIIISICTPAWTIEQHEIMS